MAKFVLITQCKSSLCYWNLSHIFLAIANLDDIEIKLVLRISFRFKQDTSETMYVGQRSKAKNKKPSNISTQLLEF